MYLVNKNVEEAATAFYSYLFFKFSNINCFTKVLSKALKMKVLSAALFSTLLVITFSKRFTEDMLLPVHRQCIKELGLEVQTIVDSVNEEFLTVEGDPSINKYCECTLRKINALDENDALKLDTINNLFVNYVNLMANRIVDNPGQVTIDATESCKNVEGSDVGDQFVKFLNCFVKYLSNI